MHGYTSCRIVDCRSAHNLFSSEIPLLSINFECCGSHSLLLGWCCWVAWALSSSTSAAQDWHGLLHKAPQGSGYRLVLLLLVPLYLMRYSVMTGLRRRSRPLPHQSWWQSKVYSIAQSASILTIYCLGWFIHQFDLVDCWDCVGVHTSSNCERTHYLYATITKI